MGERAQYIKLVGSLADSEVSGWSYRAVGYEATEWVRSPSYLKTFVTSAEIEPSHVVLEVGVGTGMVARAIGPQVIGLDLSPEMLVVARASGLERLAVGDARALPFRDGQFDRVLARMVWHHLVGGVEAATAECHRVLCPGGLMVLSEGVPPHPSLRAWYQAMFRLKERRLTFSPEGLVGLMRGAGFRMMGVWECVLPSMSIASWLDRDGLVSRWRRWAIMWMHRLLWEEGKRHYNMVVRDGDVYCDFRFVGVVGRK